MASVKGGRNMLKSGLMFLFGTFSHGILTIIAYEFYFRYALSTGGVGGDIISNIHPFIFVILIIEIIISLVLITLGMKDNKLNR